ncbi:MAG: acylphosphatase [Euryarchaeota archaeon]|nr:acylphosphatase [Euryarchaeota archaeon]
MMRRANIRIKGNVQMAGFRTFINNIADSLNVTGFAENVEDGSVKVVCEGEEEGIKKLINSIKEKTPSFARVDDVSAEYEDYKGEFTSFERRGADIPQKATLDDLLGVMKSFDSKAERLVSILDDMNVTLKSVKEDTSSIKEDTKLIPGIKENTEMMLEKQEDTTGEISALREDLRSYMENKFAKIEYEIEGIKAKIGMV